MPKLTRPPRLAPQLAKGALNSPRKRPPYDGVRLPSEPLTLDAAVADPARLAAYNAVCRFPAGRATLPPTYPHIVAFPLAMRLMAAADFPFPLLGLIHTGITLTCPVPLPATARLTLTVHAEGLAPHRKGTEFTVVTGAELDGATVWHSRSTYLCRHRKPSAPHPEHRDAEPPLPAEPPPPTHATWDLPADLGRRYAAASGDRNPIHLHPLTARLFGFRRPIAHGMWTFARCLAELGEHGEPLGAEAEFKAPVPLPTAVTFATDTTGLTKAPDTTTTTTTDTATATATATDPATTTATDPDTTSNGPATDTDTALATTPATTFALLSDRPHEPRSRVHLSGRVRLASSGGPPSGSPGLPSRSS